MPLAVERWDPQCDDEALWQAYADFKNEIGREASPDDPPRPVAYYQRRLRNRTAIQEQRVWFVRAPGETAVTATAHSFFEDRDENRHVIDFGIDVRAELRRQGLGKRLLAEIAACARETKRTLLLARTLSTMPGGEAFLQRLGAERGQVFHIIQLDLKDVDRELLKTWRTRAAERASGFELVCWDNGLPEDLLPAICDLTAVMATAPRGKMKIDGRKITPAQMREYERVRAELNIESWVIAAREKATGALAGYTQMVYDPAIPHVLHQCDTGVWPRYRARGLGRWLKAAMLERALQARPQAKFVRAGNADNNAPMLKINNELGFRLYREQGTWQVPLEQVDAFLKE